MRKKRKNGKRKKEWQVCNTNSKIQLLQVVKHKVDRFEGRGGAEGEGTSRRESQGAGRGGGKIIIMITMIIMMIIMIIMMIIILLMMEMEGEQIERTSKQVGRDARGCQKSGFLKQHIFQIPNSKFKVRFPQTTNFPPIFTFLSSSSLSPPHREK